MAEIKSTGILHKPAFYFYAGIFFYALFTVFLAHVPFFGDHTTLVSRPANFFFDTNFKSLILPFNDDTGHPPFYPLVISFTWKIFGRNLFVSHDITFAFTLFLFWQFYLLCKKFLSSPQQIAALILFIFQPTLLAQISAMSVDVLLSGLFIAGLNSIFYKKKIRLQLIITIVLLMSLRGIIISAALFFIDVFHEKKNFRQFILLCERYLLAAVPCIAWFIFHHAQTGWWLLPASGNWSGGRQMNNGIDIVSKAAEYFFRFIEFGMIIPVIILFIYLLKHFKSCFRKENLFLIAIISIISFAVFILPFKNPVIVRYILPLQCFILFLFIKILFENYSALFRNIILSFTMLLFIASQFIVYPKNNFPVYSWGDGSLAHINYFKFREEAFNYLQQQNIPVEKVFTAFPEYKSFKDTDLDKPDIHYTNLNTLKLENCEYFIYSNIMNGVSVETETILRNNWDTLKYFYRYPVEYIIFKNASF